MPSRQRRGYTTYICAIGCVADCKCSATATAIGFTEEDGQITIESYGLEVINSDRPCVIFRGEHTEHLAMEDDGLTWHTWTDEADHCTIARLCPDCEQQACPNTVVLVP